MITYHTRSDIFTFPAGARAHGCNTRGAAGGLAGEVFRRFPEMAHVYRFACEAGTYGAGDCLPFDSGDGWWYNLATQVNPGADARVGLIIESMSKAVAHASEHNVATINVPLIGCGIGGLEWSVVRQALEDNFGGYGIHLQVVTQDATFPEI